MQDFSVVLPATFALMEQAQAEMAAVELVQATHEIRIGEHVLPGRWKATSAIATFEAQSNERVYRIAWTPVEE